MKQAATVMQTFKEVFCRKFSCRAEEYEGRAFCATVYPHVRLLALFGGHNANCFSLDRAVISYVGVLRTPDEIDRELNDFSRSSENRRFTRRTLRLRLSARRFQRLVRSCYDNERNAGLTADSR